MITRILVVTLALRAGLASAQDTSRVQRADSATLDTMMAGPSYAFTGHEAPQLLVSVFRRTYELAERPKGTTIACLGLGRNATDPPAAVVAAVASAAISSRPRSACTVAAGFHQASVTESATGKRAFIIDITSMAHERGDSVVVYSAYHVGSLWASGFACFARREAGQWVVRTCVRRWIS